MGRGKLKLYKLCVMRKGWKIKKRDKKQERRKVEKRRGVQLNAKQHWHAKPYHEC